MNPLAIYQGLKQAVEGSPFANSIGVSFGWEALPLNMTTRYQITVVPGDPGNSVGPADSYMPTVDPRYSAVQHWFTTIQIQADDYSRDEADRWQATAALRNWVHAELVKLLPAGRFEIASQSYDRQQERTNRVAIILVIRTSEWIERNEDRLLQEIMASGEVTQHLLDEAEIYAVP